MAVRTRDEIMEAIRARLGDDTGDEALALIEDVSDTIDDLTARSADPENWEQRYNDLDAEWRQKYRDRFFDDSGAGDPGGSSRPPAPDRSKLTFESLFKED